MTPDRDLCATCGNQFPAGQVCAACAAAVAAPAIDAPGTACSLASLECTSHMIGAGGFDEHHEFPISLGGAADQTTMLVLCPNHHRRQHSLIRYLVERAGVEEFAVMRRFAKDEQVAARMAYSSWLTAGSPAIGGWPCPAARAV